MNGWIKEFKFWEITNYASNATKYIKSKREDV